ncbi:hypothetical protein Micbo1qcDRAFT_126172 [Microdochium bolleyi]|uniref:Tyrosinase copper-binding domain-containing protein n=1 Tax=Microdochium bolleyi TaxID=196109 RepID=A0A136INM5_9PEZI|nr:hypothetical protein Micbo1qcDRAFT_126172 [Microdochium bolleyi]
MQAGVSPSTGVTTAATEGGGGGFTTQAGCRSTIYAKWGTLSSGQKLAFVNAIKCLTQRRARGGIWNRAQTRWDELVYVHNQMVGSVHQSDLFLPWHRYYLYAFRTMLRNECSYTGPMPWWKETNNAGNFPASDIFSASYFGSLPQASSNGGGYCLQNGAFRGLNNRVNGQCVARGELKSETRSVTVANENTCQGSGGASYSAHRRCVEGTNHAYLHRGLGPTMANAAVSPADPVFFLHHSYIDWQWKRWQNAASSRWTSITNDYPTVSGGVNMDTQLNMLGLVPTRRIRDILDTEGTFLCYTYDELR